MNALVLNASPRAAGTCAGACDLACELLAGGGAVSARLDACRVGVAPCTGCEACRRTGACAIDDGMAALLSALDQAHALFVASPVYFSGPPAAYKAVLDRVQVRYWAYQRARQAGELPPKRPARLLVVGAGGDPNGYEPVVTCTRSALAVAGFALEGVHAAIGRPVEPDDVRAWLGGSASPAAAPVEAAAPAAGPAAAPAVAQGAAHA